MSRNIDPTLVTSLGAKVLCPVIFCMITFRSQTSYVWSGVGSYIWQGNTYLGVGSFGKIGTIAEGVEVRSDGTTVELSGIDPIWQGECLTDILIGAPAKIWFGNLINGQLVGTPYLLFSGCVDKPTFSPGADKLTISLALENKMIDLSRPNMRRYTSADQHLMYPTIPPLVGWKVLTIKLSSGDNNPADQMMPAAMSGFFCA